VGQFIGHALPGGQLLPDSLVNRAGSGTQGVFEQGTRPWPDAARAQRPPLANARSRPHTSTALGRMPSPLSGLPAASPRAFRPGARLEVIAIAGTFHSGVLMAKTLQRSRQHAFARQGGKCYYCGLPMWLAEPSGPQRLRCTAEHLKPRSEGGGNGPSNIVAACLHCNRTRHKRKHPPEPERYRDEVQRRIKRGGWMPRNVIAWAKSRAPQPVAGHAH